MYRVLLFFVSLYQNSKNMEIKLVLNPQLLEVLMSGKRVKGSLFIQRASNGFVELGFNRYQEGKQRRPDSTLMTLPHGAIRKSAQRYKLYLSLPDSLGESRIGELMREESLEADNFMRALEQVLKVS